MVNVGIGVLAADTGESVRALQHWCDLGVLIAEPSTEKKGRGYHRTFEDDERKWALLASALNKLRVPLGDIAKYIRLLRSHYTVENFDKNDIRNARRRFNASSIGQALKSDRDVFLMLSLQPHEKGLEVKMSLFPPIRDETDSTLKSVFKSVCVQVVEQQIGFSRETPQSHFLNLTQIWSPLRRTSV